VSAPRIPPDPGPPLGASVRLRCGHCNRLLDRAECWISGWHLNGREHNLTTRRVTPDGAVYRCACPHGRELQVSLDRVAELAPQAYKAGRDLLAGARNYGL